MTGAAYLCSKAALRSGSGIVTLGIPESLNPVMEVKLTCVMTRPLPETKASTLSNKARKEIMTLCEAHDVVALGPGLFSTTGDERAHPLVNKKYRPRHGN